MGRKQSKWSCDSILNSLLGYIPQDIIPSGDIELLSVKFSISLASSKHTL